MKVTKTLLTIVTAALAISACNKPKTGSQTYVEEKTTDTTVVVNTPDTSYYLSGLSGIVLKPLGRNSITFNTIHTDGIQRNVKLDVAGAPANMKVQLTNTSGYTPFTTTTNIDVRFVAAGIYPITVTATPDRGETKVYPVNLIVDSSTKKECNTMFYAALGDNRMYVTDAADRELNVIPGRFWIEPSGMLYINSIPMNHSDVGGDMYFTPQLMFSASSAKQLVNVAFNCETGELSIPKQTVMAIRNSPRDTIMFNVSGTGKVDLENQFFRLTYASDSATYNLEGKFSY